MVNTTINQPSSWWAVLGRLGLFVLAFAVVTGGTITPLVAALSDWITEHPANADLLINTMAAAAILAATWVMTRFVDKRHFLSIGFNWENAFGDMSKGLATGALWLGLSVGLLLIMGFATAQAPVGFSGQLALIAAASVLLNVLTQQLLVVGYIFQTIRAKGGFALALVVSSFLFSVLHIGAFEGALIPPVNVFAAGAVFCFAYGITGNLWFPIAIHFAWNVLLGPILGLTISGTGRLGLGWRFFEIEGPELITGGAFGLEGGLIVTLTTTTLVMILFFVNRRRSSITESNDR